jgi:hypothetical protein
MAKSGVIILGQDNDHPQSAAAIIEGLAFLKRFSRWRGCLSLRRPIGEVKGGQGTESWGANRSGEFRSHREKH